MPQHILRGHHSFRRRYCSQRAEFLRRLASEGQSPDAFFVGCSDSRVVPELLTSTAPGQLFVVRNVANLIPPLEHADASVGPALEYAVAHLEVPAIVVCGHDGCGGIKGALEADPGISSLPSLREWLQGAQPAIDAVAHLPPEERLRAAVEQNVLLQMDNLLTYPAVEAAVEAGRLDVHGWVYDMHSFGLRVYDEDQGIFLPVQELLAG